MPSSSVAPPRALGPRQGSGPAPLSRMQQGLVFMQQIQPEAPLHQVPLAVRLRGKVDVDVVERALRELVLRHDVLLSRIAFEGTLPTQVVDRSRTIPLERVDLRSRASGEREEALRELLERRTNVPMGVVDAPLLELAWIDLADDDHVLFAKPHPVVWDAASSAIFLRELDVLYGAFAKGEPSPLSPLPIAYADFASWHEDRIASAALDEQKKAWRERLAGELPALDFPSDRARPARMTFGGRALRFELDADERSAAAKLAEQASTSLATVLSTAYAALLTRYSGHREVLVGKEVGGRQWPETDGLVGMFVNTCILRLAVDPDRPFEEVLRGAKQLEASVVEPPGTPDLPLDVLVREMGLARDPSRAPLAQAFFAYKDQRTLPSRLVGADLAWLPLHADYETQDLTLSITETAQGVSGFLTYATDLFDASTMEAFLDHLKRFLREAARDPSVAVGKVPIVGDAELAKLDSFNATTVDFPADACVHTLVAAQAMRTPDAVAVVSVGRPGGPRESITYAEFEKRTNRLARHLRNLGVSRNVRVGIAVDRSLELVVAQVAVLKAGGAYVPLDPSYPADRLAHMAEDSAMVVLVTETALEEGLPTTTGARVRLDADADAIAASAADPLPIDDRSATPDSLAYVIYTSGSTGKPKGVLVPHRPLVNFIESMKKTPGIGPGDVVLAVTTLSFDIAVFDTLTALAAGSKVLMASREVTGDGELLRDVIENYDVTLLNATPATWRLMLAAGWNGGSAFRAITAGEALPKDLAIELASRCKEVWDLYGPTETTVWSTYWKAEAPIERVLIGHPIDNTQVHVLDPYGARCPIGVVGEIVIAGDGVTDGYMNRPELTAERFLPDPFRTAPQRALADERSKRPPRMYRTGDLGRWLRSGELEYLGRRDSQVKLRGFRIELGEIETVLLGHEAVAEAVASISNHDPTDPMLVAYVVTRAGATWTATELRKLVRSKLPPYMVPQHVVELDAMPLTPAGKVDRRHLPAPFAKAEPERLYVAPATDAERLVATICQELLRVERVSIGDNFFDLGGHSMLSLTLVARIEADAGVRLNPRVLIANTIAQVAAMLPQTTSAPSPVWVSANVGKSREPVRPPVSAPSPTPAAPSLAGRLLSRVGKKLFGR